MLLLPQVQLAALSGDSSGLKPWPHDELPPVRPGLGASALPCHPRGRPRPSAPRSLFARSVVAHTHMLASMPALEVQGLVELPPTVTSAIWHGISRGLSQTAIQAASDKAMARHREALMVLNIYTSAIANAAALPGARLGTPPACKDPGMRTS